MTSALEFNVNTTPRPWEREFSEAEFGRICRRIGRFVRNPADLQDIAQQAMLITIQKSRSKSIRSGTRISDFAVGVARNLLCTEARRQAQAIRLSQALLYENKDEADAVDEKTIGDLISKLPMRRDREVLYMYLVKGMSVGTIAKCQEVKRQHIYKVISRARQRLIQIHQVKFHEKELSVAGCRLL